MFLDRLGLWPARAIWLIAPLTIGSALSRALEAQASTPGLIVEILLWLGWFAVLVAVLTPSPRSLSVSRVAGPVAFGATILAGVFDEWDGQTLFGLAFSAVFITITSYATFGDRMINGSAYGSERRMALRPPAFVFLGPLQVSWILVFVGLAAGPLLILAERYVLAAIAVVLGAVAIWAGGRVLHQLSRRWIVFVPAGFVIHDPMFLVDSVLMRRNEVSSVGPVRIGAANEGTRIDVSGSALGLVLEVVLKKATPITIREGGQLRNLEVDTLAFSPTLPGAMLSEARIRGLKIGESSVGS